MDSPTPPLPPVSLLVRRAQSGDAAAFDRLSRHYRAAILAMAFLRTGHLDEAEDLAQDVLAKAWEKLSTLHDPDAFVPWIKAIAANACRNWYRRSHFCYAAAWDEELPVRMAHLESLPLEQVLNRERQRVLHEALLRLPEANRAALMMHVWGGYAYEEIAAFTGVPLTTVEGRIFRAKRQLRRLLTEQGRGVFDKPSAVPTRPRRLPMSQPVDSQPSTPPAIGHRTSETDETPPLSQSSALAVFSRRLAAMIDSGIGLVRTFQTLEEAPEPYGTAAAHIRGKIEQGYTLSRTMHEEGLFSDLYVALVRAGEVGGCLEETLRRAVRLLALEAKLARQRPSGENPRFFSQPIGTTDVREWTELSLYEREVRRILFCEVFSMLLMSGVPMGRALETLALLLPPGSQAGLRQSKEEVENGGSMVPGLERMGIFPRFVLQMIAVGEEGGHLDRTLHLAAETLGQELEGRVMD